ncbi:MAG: hypothetical protein P4N24_10945 [Acidobacteriota bacterium]|nr:hypothetical protein [Acidobacteriota bacterium]
MNSTRILKEARPLFWPWCVVALAGAVPLVYPLAWTPLIYLLGFFVVPLMATPSLGDEFQYRTLSLMLSQPVGRMVIWGEKLSVTAVAIVSAVLVFSLALRATSFHPIRQELAFAVAWIAAITASATFWTLFTRSTVGGVALNIGIQSFISFAIPWANLAEGLRARGYLSPVNAIVIPTITIVCYAGVMLWLGWRKLVRFQVTGGMGSDDLLMAGPDVIPVAWAGWLHCRSTGPVLNLLRKELRLLRPVWLITLLAAVGWSCLTLFGLFYGRGYSRNFETAVIGLGVVSTLMIAILAGTMSLGEERTSGTHAWNLSLPASARVQWGVKLFVALFAGFVGAGLVPMLTVGRFILRSSRTLGDMNLGNVWLLGVLVLTFAAFWCACAVDGTVAAALWVIPVIGVLSGAGYFAKWWGHDVVLSLWGPSPRADYGSNWLVASVAQRHPQAFNLLGNLRFDWWAASVTYRHLRLLDLLDQPISYAALLGTVLILAVVQSYRLFRAQPHGRTRSVVWNLLPLASLVFLCGFSLTVLNEFWWRAGLQVYGFFNVTSNAVQKALPGVAKLHPTEPLQLTGDDVAAACRGPFESSARRWLRGARITITPDNAHPNGFLCGEDHWGHTRCYYSATIHLADGTDIFESSGPGVDRKNSLGIYSMRVRWPGAASEETLWER